VGLYSSYGLKGIVKVAIVAHFKVLFRNLSLGTQQKHGKCQNSRLTDILTRDLRNTKKYALVCCRAFGSDSEKLLLS
jgi:hypothetical protein